METMKLIKRLYKCGKITKQEMKTYRGQVLHGDEGAALVGLRRKKLIE